MPWFVSGGQPVYTADPMNMLGATMGRGVTPSPYAGVDNSATFQSIVDEERRKWDADYDQKQQKLDNDYEIAARNAATAEEKNEVDRWYRQESVKLERERMAIQERQFGEEMAFKRAGLGYNLLNMASQLRGPANYAQAAAFSRGLSQIPETPTFLDALRGQTNLAAFQAPGGAPTPESLGTLMAKVGGDPSGGVAGGNPEASVAAARNMVAEGAHKLKNLHTLNPMEQQMFGSLAEAGGADLPTFLSSYRRSRPNNNMRLANIA